MLVTSRFIPPVSAERAENLPLIADLTQREVTPEIAANRATLHEPPQQFAQHVAGRHQPPLRVQQLSELQVFPRVAPQFSLRISDLRRQTSLTHSLTPWTSHDRSEHERLATL